VPTTCTPVCVVAGALQVSGNTQRDTQSVRLEACPTWVSHALHEVVTAWYSKITTTLSIILVIP
jgi:hypothetical protein